MMNNELLKLIEQINKAQETMTAPALSLSKHIARVINNPLNDMVDRVSAPMTAITKSMKIYESLLPNTFYKTFFDSKVSNDTPDKDLTAVGQVIQEIDMRVLAMIFFFSDMPIKQQKDYCKRYQKNYYEVSRKQKPLYRNDYIKSLNNHSLPYFLKTIEGAIQYMKEHKIKGIRKAYGLRTKVMNNHIKYSL